MLKRLYVTLVAVLVVGWAAYTQASAISYNETFAYGSTATLATDGANYTPHGSFTGAASPNPTWTSDDYSGTTIVGNGISGIIVNAGNDVHTYLQSQTGLAYAPLSQPVTVSATLTANNDANNDPAGGLFGLLVGGLKFEVQIGSKFEGVFNGDSISIVHSGTELSGNTAVGTPVVFTGTLSKSGEAYSLDYSIGSFSTTGCSVTVAQLGTLSSTDYGLGFFNNLNNGGTLTVSHFSVTTPAPEPGTALLLSTGLIGLLAYAWRKQR